MSQRVSKRVRPCEDTPIVSDEEDNLQNLYDELLKSYGALQAEHDALLARVRTLERCQETLEKDNKRMNMAYWCR